MIGLRNLAQQNPMQAEVGNDIGKFLKVEKSRKECIKEKPCRLRMVCLLCLQRKLYRAVIARASFWVRICAYLVGATLDKSMLASPNSAPPSTLMIAPVT